MPDTPLQSAIALLANDSPAVEARRLLDARENVILYGPPGTGKSHAAMVVAAEWEGDHGSEHVIHTTFHPSYSYEDFIEGFRPSSEDPAQFTLTDGVLLRAAERAKTAPTLLVIDEINRADVAKVFGELITYIEASKRDREFATAQNPSQRRMIPKDLYVMGTMNTADKSVSLLDVALRRRFKFIECPPDPRAFESNPAWEEEVGGLRLGHLLDELNARLLNTGISRERLLGQAMLAVDRGAGESRLLDRIRYDVYPLIEEYLFGDVEQMNSVLPGLVDERRGLVLENLTMANVLSWVPAAMEHGDGPETVIDPEDDTTEGDAGGDASAGI